MVKRVKKIRKTSKMSENLHIMNHSDKEHRIISKHMPIPIPLYIGIAILYSSDTICRFGIYIHDGFWSYDFYKEKVTTPERLYDTIIDFIRVYQFERQCKVVMAGLVNCKSSHLHNLGRRLWFELDIVPCILRASGSSLDEKSCSAARKTNQYISPTGLPGLCKIEVGYRHEVEVDSNGKLSYCSLEDYRPFITDDTWMDLLKTSELVRKSRKRIVFFNSTPQGGGVAIIRHSTIRMFKLLDIDAHWFVMKPNPEVFEITKKKFHNVLQGVAPSDTKFTNHDKILYEKWCDSNIESYWKDDDGPIYNADVIVIDDPQPSGLIPRLKLINKNALFVYRSHIEIRSDLAARKETLTGQVWDYLWNNIKECDVFVSHPIDEFIPQEVHDSNLVVKRMPAITDPCDGLNKTLNDFSLQYYHLMFNRCAFDQTRREVDFSRPYFIQISRFDPSKGIPDLIEAYMGFRKSLRNTRRDEDASKIPQLVITGHGSIDDPEGSVIYRKIMCTLESFTENTENNSDFVDDIILVRLGPSDQMLNAVLSSATCAFQLSLREGFEVKVSESLLKGVPVVAYASGGIPLQIRDNVDGHLVETGDITKVTQIMERLYTDQKHLDSLSKEAAKTNRECVLTPYNVLNWNKIILEKDSIKNRSQT